MPEEQQHWYDFPAIDWKSLFHPTFGYQYFRQPLQLPDPTGVTPEDTCTPLTAAWIADAAMLAYGRSGASDMALLEFDELLDRVQLRGHRIGNWSPEAKSVKAFFAYNSRFAVLSFRGTKKINWANSAVDLAAFAAREHLSAASQAAGAALRSLDGKEASPARAPEVLVHSGFQLALNTVWPDIELSLEAYRKKCPLAPVFFTGHSLGAAFATMAVARFEGGRAALYTFGSPRVGNRAFCDHVRERADLGICRFVNNRDLMTCLPPRDRSFEHTCGLIHIGPDGNVATEGGGENHSSAGMSQMLHEAATAVRDYVGKLPPPEELVDHAQRRYCYYIWRWARNGQVP